MRSLNPWASPSRSPAKKCSTRQPQKTPSSSNQSLGVPHVRTSVCGSGKPGEALPLFSSVAKLSSQAGFLGPPVREEKNRNENRGGENPGQTRLALTFVAKPTFSSIQIPK
jgi:hypothetical protein